MNRNKYIVIDSYKKQKKVDILRRIRNSQKSRHRSLDIYIKKYVHCTQIDRLKIITFLYDILHRLNILPLTYVRP